MTIKPWIRKSFTAQIFFDFFSWYVGGGILDQKCNVGMSILLIITLVYNNDWQKRSVVVVVGLKQGIVVVRVE